MQQNFETVIGLEVHVELNTATKIFCGCPTAFGAPPNSLCCPICAGLPGGMPTLNRGAVEKAILAGLALHCEISELCLMDRKQYFYPDLPKAYQISQDRDPVCKNGYLDLRMGETVRRIGITRIHLEEDAGKLIHTEAGTLVDYNRSGVPLIEIVTEPDLRSGAEAAEFLRELRRVLLACGVSTCKMQEGAMRCDVNLSIRPVGADGYGERTEIKNLNSFSFVEKAIALEAQRQTVELGETGVVRRRTVRYLPRQGKTEPMREKVTAAEYRFFPDPDLRPFRISPETVERIRAMLPELPAQKRERLQREYGIARSAAEVLVARDGLAEYFEETAKDCAYPVVVSNLLINELLALAGEDESFSAEVRPCRLRELAEMAGNGEVNRAVAKKLLLRLTEADFSPRAVATQEALLQISDPALIREWIALVIEEDPGSAADYRGGKKNAFRALQGRLMKKSGGRIDPALAERMLLAALEEKGDAVCTNTLQN